MYSFVIVKCNSTSKGTLVYVYRYNECHYGGMYNVYVKRIFVITEIVHMNAGVSSESRERKRLKSLSHSHEAWHPRSTPTSSAGSGASQNQST